MTGKKQYYRLFKVAKELNVGTAMLVEHLQGNGHSVENSPNTKLSAELYDLLLKEFASEKLMKEKAELLSERRKEDVRVNTVRPTPVEEPPKEEEETSEEFLSANELRSTLSPNKEVESTEEPEIVAKTETPKPPVQEENGVSKETLDDSEIPRLKVIGKIDLDNLNKKPADKKKEKPPVEEKKPTPIVQEKKEEIPPTTEEVVEEVVEEPKVEEKTPVKTEPVAEQKQEVVEAEPEVKEEKKAEVVEETPVEKKKEVEVVPEISKTKIETETKTETEIETEAKAESEETPTPEEIIRAGDSMPQLSGLKVMGKIELPSARRKRKKDKAKEEAKAKAPSTPEKPKTEGEEEPAKRRRRRKRKRKSAVQADSKDKTDSNSGNNRTKKGKKEKPTTKEVDQSIRNTLSQMGRGASRSRQRLRRAKRDSDLARRELQEQIDQEGSRVLQLTEFITANEFANLIDVQVTEIITKSFQLGMMISINQRLDAELLTIIAEEYGFDVEFVDVTEDELEIEEIEDKPEDLMPRSPIITVMGHVDHGKTTLLDYLRKTNVTSQEAGGITQHIGAYEVSLKTGQNVTFLDTPGHEAFTAMRARGAKATDVAIIVVAADDAVMPQTKEAINHAQAANVPMIFAINKMDRESADPERIKGQLAEMNILVEDWGGKFQSQEISALKGTNVDELLEKVILESELLDLKANPNRSSAGTVIEARLDKGLGNVATMLVQTGTLKVGDEMVAGIHYGKVRAIINQNGKRIKKAGPSMPVQVLGLSGQPQAGDRFHIFEESGKAKSIAQKRSELYREQQFRQTKRITLEEIGRRRAIGNFKELNVIIRGDVDGSVEALSGSLLKLSTDEVQVNILWKGVGAISEADINLAMASDAIVIAFNVRPNAQARSLAEREKVDIRTYSVIYDAINDVKDALEGLLSPEIKEEIMGTAEVREVFKVSKVGNVAGSYVTSGKIKREHPIRIIRDGVVISDGKLSSLKRFKDDVKEVANGFEFGFMVENYNDIQEGDVLESYKQNEVRRKL